MRHLLEVETSLIIHVESHVLENEIDPATQCSRLRPWNFHAATPEINGRSSSVGGAEGKSQSEGMTSQGRCSVKEDFAQIDLIICLGGDGAAFFFPFFCIRV